MDTIKPQNFECNKNFGSRKFKHKENFLGFEKNFNKGEK